MPSDQHTPLSSTKTPPKQPKMESPLEVELMDAKISLDAVS
jgi:hypothetical protein